MHLRIATRDDIPAIEMLMAESMAALLPKFLDEKQVERSSESMGVDTLLVDDGTYFLVYVDETLAGCGGWSRRRTLYGGNHTTGRDDELADPATEPAKIRAMYTHPDFTRRGIGRFLLEAGENAARAEGFKSMEMGSTAPGRPLYEACGYVFIEDLSQPSEDGTVVPILRMRKELV
ncbi:MAG: GNAT family N-acetyltransferase [Pseudomonadota bacterium]|nr:GNAT family N-acetyltransferase [Pseudomonadota bacterium]